MTNARSFFLSALLSVLMPLCSSAQFGPANEVATDVDYGVHAKIEAVDLDGDDDLDVLFLSNTALVWVSNVDGAGNFGAPQPLASSITHFGAVDLDGDGDIDVAVADPFGQLSWVENVDGLGSFGQPQAIGAVGSALETLICTDLNGDGLPDVALTTSTVDGATLRVLINAGGVLSFAATFPYGSEGPGLRMVHGDIDTDGATDLVCLDGDSMVYVLLNATGDALTWSAVEMGATVPNSRLQLIDVDDDGDLDLILSNWGLLQWGENISSSGNVVPFTRYDVGQDGQGNHWGHAFRFGCGSKLMIAHRQGLSGFLYWNVFDQALNGFVPPDQSFLLSNFNSEATLTADLNGDGRQDILNIAFGMSLTLNWYTNEFPEEQEPTSIDLDPFQPLCEFDEPFVLPEPLSTNGYWTGPGVNGFEFDPTISGPGTFLLTYRVASPCPISAQAEIVVSSVSTDLIELLPLDTLCASGGAYPLDGFAIPSGGTWSGPGVDANVFTPPGAGSFELSYATTEPCAQVQSNIEVIDDPNIDVVSGQPDGCNLEPVVLAAQPSGGTWGGLADANGLVDQSCAVRPIGGNATYTYNAPNGDCVGSAFGSIFLNSCLSPPPLGADTVLCNNDAYVLSWSFGGGGNVFWDITGADSTISSGPGGSLTWYFSPFQKAPGLYTIAGRSSSSSPGSCPGLDTLFVTVLDPPIINIGNHGPLCSNGTPIALTGSPVGGTWNGVGVSGGQFEPAAVGAGTWTVTYTVSEGICSNTDSTTIVVTNAPDAGTDGTVELCANGAPISLFAQLGGTPQFGGVWTSPQGFPSSGIFLPGIDPEGAFTYAVNGSVACGNATATVLVSVLPAPNAGVSSSVNVCSNSAPIDLRLALAGSPEPNGTWSGPSPTSGLFDPATMVAGLYTYTVSGTALCPDASAALNIEVVQETNAGIGGTIEICSSASALDLFSQLSGSPQLGGTWTGPDGPSNGIYIPGQSPSGIYQYSVVAIGPCPNATATVLVTELTAPNAGVSNSVSLCSDSAPIDMRQALGGTPDPNGTWSGPDPTSGFFDPLTMLPGLYTYTIISTGECPDATATLSVSVTQAPNAGVGGTWDICADAQPMSLFALLGGTPMLGGTWTRAGTPSSGIFNPVIDTEGIYTYTVSGVSPCGNASAQLMVNVIELQLDAIDGPTIIDEVEPLSFSALPFLADADSFSWSIPEDWSWVTTDTTLSTVELLPPAQAGSDTICVTAYGGVCSGNTVCLVTELSVGIRGYAEARTWFTVHPNPSEGIFQLTPQGSNGARTEILVYDALGQLVAGPFVLADQQPYTLRLEDRSSGMYFMRVVRGGEVKVVEIVIQR